MASSLLGPPYHTSYKKGSAQSFLDAEPRSESRGGFAKADHGECADCGRKLVAPPNAARHLDESLQSADPYGLMITENSKS